MPRKKASAVPTDAPPEPLTAAPAIASSNVDVLAGLLTRAAGATVAEMVKATGWQAHSVRGAMWGILNARRKLSIASIKTDGVRTYRATLQEVQA